MRDYEIVYIFDSAVAEDQINEKLDRFHGVMGGEVTAVDHWGKRRLAYPIQNHENGYYVVEQFTADPDNLSELERVLKLDDDLLRFLIVLNEGQPAAPMSLSARQEEFEADEAEEEDVEEEEEE